MRKYSAEPRRIWDLGVWKSRDWELKTLSMIANWLLIAVTDTDDGLWASAYKMFVHFLDFFY